MGKNSFFLTVIVVLIGVFNFLNPIGKNWNRLSGKFDAKLAEKKYNNSQYVIPQSKKPISDEELLSYAGYKYATGLNPILINSDHPPLGKYIIGWFILLTNNIHSVSLFFAIGNILLLGYIVYLLTGSHLLVAVSFLFLSLDTVFLDQIIYSPVLDIIQVFFLLIYILFYSFFLTNNRNINIFLMGLALGVIAAVKLYFPAIILLFVTAIHFWLNHKSKDVIKVTALLFFLAFIVYSLSYSNYFLAGNSFRNFLGTQKWIFLFWKNNSVNVSNLYGSVIPFILFNRWKVWWGNSPYINFEHWSIFWPVFFILGTASCIYFLRKINNNEFRGISLFLCLWIIIFTLYLCFIPISPRYLMMLYIPIYILISLFIKHYLKHFEF